MPHLDLELKENLSSFRKTALGTWKTSYDPSVYGTIEVTMDRALEYIEDFRRETGKRLTVTHMMARAVAAALRKSPEANALLRLNRIYLRKRIGILFQVAMTDEGSGKIDLSGATLYDVHEKSLEQIVDEFEEKVRLVRERRDPSLEKSRNLFQYIPYSLVGPVLRTMSFLLYTLNLDLRKLGLPDDPFGSVMITNIGTLGLDIAYAPLVPYSRVPIILATGAVKEVPVVEEGKIRVRHRMNINATFDHRLIDGFHAAVMSSTLRAFLEDPYTHFGPVSG